MNRSNKILGISVSVMAAAVAVMLFAIFMAAWTGPATVRASGGVAFSLCDTNNNTGTSSPYASLVYSNVTIASSTIVCSTRNATSFDFNIQVSATGTAPTIQFQVQRSMDGVTWYGEDTNSTTGAVITHSPTNAYHTWAPGTAATTTRNITFSTQHENYVKVSFQSLAASSTIYAQVIPNNVIPN